MKGIRNEWASGFKIFLDINVFAMGIWFEAFGVMTDCLILT